MSTLLTDVLVDDIEGLSKYTWHVASKCRHVDLDGIHQTGDTTIRRMRLSRPDADIFCVQNSSDRVYNVLSEQKYLNHFQQLVLNALNRVLP